MNDLTCEEIQEKIEALLSKILDGLTLERPVSNDLEKIINEIEKYIQFSKNKNCVNEVSRSYFEIIEKLLKILKHVFGIKISVDDEIKKMVNPLEIVTEKISEIINQKNK